MISSKGGWGLGGRSTLLSCKMFCDFTTNKSHLLDRNIFTAYFETTLHLTAFVDLVYRCGLENRTLHVDIFQ